MKQSNYTEKIYNSIAENVKQTAELFHTSKPEIAIVLGVSERTVDNRFSGNVNTPFTVVELLKLCSFWDISLNTLISPKPRGISGLISELEETHKCTVSLLKKQIEMKGTIS